MNLAKRAKHLNHLDQLEAESIHIFREVAATFERPVLLYSAGKDASVLLRLALKAFAPGKLPFPLLHVDTGYRFPEMAAFRDEGCEQLGVNLIVSRAPQAEGTAGNPSSAQEAEHLLSVLREGKFDAAIGGARRDEGSARAKERVFSFRDRHGHWDPKNQRPELWNLFNGTINEGENIRVFPLSNWTELDVWLYIYREKIAINSLYFAQERQLEREGRSKTVMSRYRTLGGYPHAGLVASSATTLEGIIAETITARESEYSARAGEPSMEQKQREGYF